jgi:holo-[acyl-carrier protein] synthase
MKRIGIRSGIGAPFVLRTRTSATTRLETSARSTASSLRFQVRRGAEFDIVSKIHVSGRASKRRPRVAPCGHEAQDLCVPIVSIGLDLMEIARVEDVIARRGQRFLERIYTPAERDYCERRAAMRATHYAGRYALKEAVMKVLGTGWTRGVRWRDIEVHREPSGPPQVILHGRSAEHARARGIARIHATISHDGGIAAAMAVAEGA